MSHHDCLRHSTALPAGGADAGTEAARALGFHRIRLGDLRITALFDGSTPLPFDKLMTGAAPDVIERRLAADGKRSPVDTPINTYLIDTGERRILVDTGAGTNFGPRCGKLAAHLVAAGYAPSQVDAVLLTHIHPDHVGGLVTGGAMAFPAAELLISSADVDYWFDAAEEAAAPPGRKEIFEQSKAGVAPYLDRGKVRTFAAGEEVLPGIRTIPAPGHTAGHTLLRVESLGNVIIFFGDLAHSAAVQMPDPSIAITLDSDEATAVATREKWFERFACDHTLLAGAHMIFPGIGHIGRRGSGFEWLPLPGDGMAGSPYETPPEGTA